MITSHFGILRRKPIMAGFPVNPPSQYGSPSISTADIICGRQAEARTASTEISLLRNGRLLAVRIRCAYRNFKRVLSSQPLEIDQFGEEITKRIVVERIEIIRG